MSTQKDTRRTETSHNDTETDVEHIEQRLRDIRLEQKRLRVKEKELVSVLIERSKKDTWNKDKEPVAMKTDVFGNSLSVGDNVLFLMKGRFEPGVWTIYGLTDTRVLCKNGTKKSYRAYKHVKKAA